MKTVADCQHDALVLAGLLDGLGKLDNEHMGGTDAITSMIEVAHKNATQLADDLEKLGDRK